MKIIKCLSEKIEEELHDADAYIELAMRWKAEYPETADVFAELSAEEMGHVDKLHDEVAKLIEEHRREHGEPPKEMMVLYDFLHEKHIGNAMQIKVKQARYKA